jgi:hypothetical protein
MVTSKSTECRATKRTRQFVDTGERAKRPLFTHVLSHAIPSPPAVFPAVAPTSLCFVNEPTMNEVNPHG